MPDAGEKVTTVARSETSCSFLTLSDGAEVEQWLYRLPLLTLRSRTFSRRPEGVICIDHCDAFSPEGFYVDQSLYGLLDLDQQSVTPLPSVNLRVFDGEQELLDLVIGDESCTPLVPEIFGSMVVSPVLEKEGVRVRVVDFRVNHVTAQLFFASANRVSTRLTENTLTIADNLGRVIVVDLRRNCSLRNFRI